MYGYRPLLIECGSNNNNSTLTRKRIKIGVAK